MNTELIEQNVHRLLGAMTGAATTAMAAVGDQLGLYRALAGGCLFQRLAQRDHAVHAGQERLVVEGALAVGRR